MSFQSIADSLPSVAELKLVSMAIAALDAIVMSEWEQRYYSYDAHWGEAEELASMRDGSGNEYGVVFAGGGAFIRGFDHESKLSPWQSTPPTLQSGLFQGLPSRFTEYAEEASFALSGIPAFTSCFWNSGEPGEGWSFGTTRGEAEYDEGGIFASFLTPTPSFYVQHALAVYERAVEREAVTTFYELAPATRHLILAVNPEVDLESALEELVAIGYPISP